MQIIGLLDLEPQAGDWDAVERFIYAGRAIFTLKSKRTGRDFTYRIRKAPNSKDRFFADIEIGYLKWQYIGSFIWPFTGRTFLGLDKESFRNLIWFLHSLSERNTAMLDQIEFKHLGRCGRCGRPLTDSESIDRGIGPDCWAKMEDQP